MGEPGSDSGFSDFDNDYQVIRLSLSWGSLSIVAFVVTLTLSVVGDNFGASFGQLIVAIMGLSVAGCVFGLVGLKFGRSRGVARVGAFLNGAVVFVATVVLPVVFQIYKPG